MKESVAEKLFKQEIFDASPREVYVNKVEPEEITVLNISAMVRNKIIRDGKLLSPSCEDTTHI